MVQYECVAQILHQILKIKDQQNIIALISQALFQDFTLKSPNICRIRNQQFKKDHDSNPDPGFDSGFANTKVPTWYLLLKKLLKNKLLLKIIQYVIYTVFNRKGTVPYRT